jgi:hypothetical protein
LACSLTDKSVHCENPTCFTLGDASVIVIVMPDGFNATARDLIIALAAHHRVPTIYFNRHFAEQAA